jgi:hypothetical protein
VVIILKKGDFLIILFIILAGLTWLLRGFIWVDTGNNFAVIEVNGKHYKTVSMKKDSKYKIDLPHNKYMELAIENQKAWIIEETVECPQKICIKTGQITKAGQSIVCLPNKVVIYIKGSDQSEIDDLSF